MKSSSLALAATGVFAAAGVQAQSSVTLFGTVDIGVGRYTSGAASATKVISNGNASSLLGFRGNEDLGGGLAAHFWLEASVFPDSGVGLASNTNNQPTGAGASAAGGQGLTFNRRATVSVSSSTYGELRLGRDFVPTFWNLTVFDPFGTNSVARSNNLNQVASAVTNTVASNMVAYHYGYAPNAMGSTGSGVYGSLAHAVGENPGGTPNASDGRYTAWRIGYNNGKVNLAASSGKTQLLSAGDITQSNAGVSYDFGVAKLYAQYAVNKQGLGARNTTALVGARLPVGSGYIPVSFMRYTTDGTAVGAARQFGIGYVHLLSKRTAVYGTYARMSNEGGAALAVGNAPANTPNGSSRGYEVGIRHFF